MVAFRVLSSLSLVGGDTVSRAVTRQAANAMNAKARVRAAAARAAVMLAA